MNQKKASEAFTLTELMIVIAILGILASLAIPRLFPQTERARAAEAVSILSAIRQGEEAFRLQNGTYAVVAASGGVAYNAVQWNQLGMDPPAIPANGGPFFDYSVIVNNGVAPPRFRATATRANVTPASADIGNTINITVAGAFCGTHTFSPTGGACPAV